MKFSHLQEAIFEFASNESLVGECAAVMAGAGTGKTSTIVEMVRRISPRYSILLVAFNKSIADELKRRVPSHAKVMTYHAVGLSALKRKYPSSQISNKLRNIVWDSGILTENQQKVYGTFVLQLTNFAKMNGVGYLKPDTAKTYLEIIDHHEMFLEQGSIEEAIELTQKVLEASFNDKATVDFADMLYLPLREELPFSRNDFVIVDEYQDTDPVQQHLISRMLKISPIKKDADGKPLRTGRLIAVGDPHQAIYGFRGADSEAMARVIKEFKCHKFPLSITYRCPRAVVEVANTIVPELEPGPDAIEGEVRHLGKVKLSDFTTHDAILCRVTAPLIQTAFWFLKQRFPAKVMGREIGQNLISLIRKMRARDLDHLEEKLKAWAAAERERLTKKKEENRIAALDDKIDCISVFIENLDPDHRTIEALIESIASLFKDGNGSLILATVHKAKGLEWKNVFILDADKYMPSRWAKRPWMKIQEQNIIYVAVTRAMEKLTYIQSEGFYAE